MRKYKDKVTGKRVVEVEDLSFLRDRDYPYTWFQRHYHHHRLRRALRKADLIIARDKNVSTDLVRYYFTPKCKIIIRS